MFTYIVYIIIAIVLIYITKLVFGRQSQLLIEANVAAIEYSRSNIPSSFKYEVGLSKKSTNTKESISDTEIVRLILHFVYKMFYISELTEQILIYKFISDVVKSTQINDTENNSELINYLQETEKELSIISSFKSDKNSTVNSKSITIKYFYFNIINRKIITKLPLSNYKYQFCSSIVALVSIYIKKFSPIQVAFLVSSFKTMVESSEVKGKLNNPDFSFHNRDRNIEIKLNKLSNT